MLKVGLTGSIAVGKSYVCGVLARNGCRVIDADTISREIVEPGAEGLRRIVSEFGTDVLDTEGRLDRAKLGKLVFDDEAKRQLLNSLLHPLVIEAQDDWLRRAGEEDPDGIAVVDAALMIESGGYKRFDKLIVVWCEPEIQLRRLMKRNDLSPEEAEKRIKSQMPQEEKKEHADFLIDTSGTFEETEEQVLAVLSCLRATSDR